jgi:hypothetical protein
VTRLKQQAEEMRQAHQDLQDSMQYKQSSETSLAAELSMVRALELTAPQLFCNCAWQGIGRRLQRASALSCRHVNLTASRCKRGLLPHASAELCKL